MQKAAFVLFFFLKKKESAAQLISVRCFSSQFLISFFRSLSLSLSLSVIIYLLLTFENGGTFRSFLFAFFVLFLMDVDTFLLSFSDLLFPPVVLLSPSFSLFLKKKYYLYFAVVSSRQTVHPRADDSDDNDDDVCDTQRKTAH